MKSPEEVALDRRCTPGGKSLRTCETHGYPLYPDGLCALGKELGMDPPTHPNPTVPTPPSAFAPPGLPPSSKAVPVVSMTAKKAKALLTLAELAIQYPGVYRAFGLGVVEDALREDEDGSGER